MSDSLEDIVKSELPEFYKMCQGDEAERVLLHHAAFDEISDWAVNDQSKNVDYAQVKLLLGQNLASKPSLAFPIPFVNFGSLNLINILSDLNQGNLNLNDYSNNNDERYAYFLDERYVYFLERKGGSENLGYEHQELAGVDAEDGLVLFNLQNRNSV